MRPVHHIVNINTNDIEKANPFTFNVDDLNGVMDLTVETAYTLILLRDHFFFSIGLSTVFLLFKI